MVDGTAGKFCMDRIISEAFDMARKGSLRWQSKSWSVYRDVEQKGIVLGKLVGW